MKLQSMNLLEMAKLELGPELASLAILDKEILIVRMLMTKRADQQGVVCLALETQIIIKLLQEKG